MLHFSFYYKLYEVYAVKKTCHMAGGVKNGKFVTLTPFQKNRPKSMKPPRPTQRKFAFKLSYSNATTKNKETFHFFDRFIYYLLVSIKSY
jgi:hypothetical protein